MKHYYIVQEFHPNIFNVCTNTPIDVFKTTNEEDRKLIHELMYVETH